MSELDALLRSGTGRAVLDAILGSMPSFAFIADRDGRIVRASGFVGGLTGLEPDSFIGRKATELRQLVETADREGRLLRDEELPIVRALKGELVLGAECLVLARSGERIPLTINAAPFRTAEGHVIGAITAGAPRPSNTSSAPPSPKRRCCTGSWRTG
jgi:PAS domain S-box-containing protein